MKNNKQLWDLVKSISDSKLCEKNSTKPFIPHHIDGLLSYLAPHFYSQHKLNQMQHYHQSIKRLLKKKKTGKKKIVVTPDVKIYEIIDIKESICVKEGINFATFDGNFGFADKPWSQRFVIMFWRFTHTHTHTSNLILIQ
jgi:hypothetical protein